MEFTDKIAFITGAASGVGLATAQAFASAGARVALVDRDPEGLARTQAAVQNLGGKALVLSCDVTQRAAQQAAVEATVKAWGRIDCAVNSAGVEGATLPLIEEDEALFERVMAINVRGVWAGMQLQIRQMLAQQPGGGAIVNVSSAAGLVGSARCAVYSASKHAVIGLTRSAALQYARQGIRVNAICPGGVQTPMAERIVASFDGAPPSAGGARYPLGRYSTPQEIASGILWLCSPGAGSAVGSVLTMDSGFTAA